VDVVLDDAPRPVNGSRRRAVLAVLALHAGEMVGVDLIVDAVWGGAAPPTAVNTVQRHVSALRQVFGTGTAVVARSRGYILRAATDVADAESAIVAGSRSADAGERRNRLETALALWRGPALLDVGGTAWLDAQSTRLESLRMRVRRDLVETRLSLGEHDGLVPELEELTGRFPFDEQAHAQLMLALYRAGRQVEALAAFRRLENALATEIGIDPGQALRDLHAAILRQDAGLDPVPREVTGGGSRLPVPAQLPPAVSAFAGRGTALAQLDALLPTGTPVVVSGTAGVGKTTLVVQWAHRAAARFPDGQLHVDLRGFGPDQDLVTTADAIRGFLDAWAVPTDRIPRDVPAQVALYRSLLAGKRVLVVLDNARDAGQVRPLLPGAPGCAVVVTSRHRLEPLMAAGARLLTLDPLDAGDADEFLARRLGADRVAAEPDAVAAIVARCAGLPLALAVVAGRAVARPAYRLADHAAELHDACGLDALRGGDEVTDVRTVLSWSHDALTPDAARLFRYLGLHPGPVVSEAAAASLAGRPLPRVRTLLTELVDGNLLVEPGPGRFVPHDLLHAFAREQAARPEYAAGQPAVVRRMVDHYLHTAHAAAVLLDPHRDRPALPPACSGVVPADLADGTAALAWFAAERPALIAVLHRMERDGLDAQVWQLAWSLADALERRGRWDDAVATQRAGLAAAGRTGDRSEQARMHRILARTLLRLDRVDEARMNLDAAITRAGPAADPAAQGHAHLTLAEIHARQDREPDALRQARLALELFWAADHVPGTTLALNAVGWFAARTGHLDMALTHCRQALALARRTGDRTAEASIWDSLGLAYRGLDRRRGAVRCYRRAVALYGELEDRYEEATSRINLAAVYGPDEPARAEAELRTALAVLDELDHPDADDLRRRLGR
jgi:DNA-binding SARP family transcriptional activator